MKLILTNRVTLNGGDAAIGVAMKEAFDSLSQERIEWLHCDSNAADAAKYYPELSFRNISYELLIDDIPRHGLRARLFRFRNRIAPFLVSGWRGGLGKLLLPAEFLQHVEAYKGSDGMVSAGGTYLVEHYDVVGRLLEFTIARSLNIPLFLYTQSLGPFVSTKSRRRVKEAFDYASLIFLRDKRSLDHVLDLGVDQKKCSVHADAAFGLYEDSRSPVHSRGGSPRVAVSVRNWRHFRGRSAKDGMEKYLRAVAAAVTHLVNRYDAEVTFVSTCQGMPEYRTDDSKIAAGLCESYLTAETRRRVTVDHAFRQVPQLIEYLRGFDFTICTRMHLAVLSMVAGVPPFAVAYEFKTRELFHSLGLDWCNEDIETVSADSMVSNVDRFLSSLDSVRERIRSEMPRLRASSREPAEKIMAVLQQPSAQRAIASAAHLPADQSCNQTSEYLSRKSPQP